MNKAPLGIPWSSLGHSVKTIGSTSVKLLCGPKRTHFSEIKTSHKSSEKKERFSEYPGKVISTKMEFYSAIFHIMMYDILKDWTICSTFFLKEIPTE